MLYEGSELLGAKGFFKLHCSQHWAPRASLSYTVVASFGNLLRAQNLGIVCRHFEKVSRMLATTMGAVMDPRNPNWSPNSLSGESLSRPSGRLPKGHFVGMNLKLPGRGQRESRHPSRMPAGSCLTIVFKCFWSQPFHSRRR